MKIVVIAILCILFMGNIAAGPAGNEPGKELLLRKIESWPSIDEKQVDTDGQVHYASHNTRLTHGHRGLCLTPNFEMLHLTCDFKTLPLMPARCQPEADVTFRNQASDVIFCDHVPDVQYESGYVGMDHCFKINRLSTANSLSIRLFICSFVVVCVLRPHFNSFGNTLK